MSKGFRVVDGDTVVNTKDIEIVTDDELLRQTVELVISTNQGEWFSDPMEGIERALILKKGYDRDEIRATIEAACLRVNDTLTMIDFTLEVDAKRHAKINFKLLKPSGEVMEVSTYAG